MSTSEEDDKILDDEMAAMDLGAVEEMTIETNTPPPPQLPATSRLPAIAQPTWRLPQVQAPPVPVTVPPAPAPPAPAPPTQDPRLPPQISQMPVPWASSQTSQLTVC